MDENPIALNEGILSHDEGVSLMPANISLSGMEVSLVNAMNREKILKQYLDSMKRQYDYVLIDCMPSLGMLTINALAAADSVIIPVQAQYLPAKGLEQLYSGKRTTEIIGEQVGESYKQVQHYIRLTELIPPILDMVDGVTEQKMAFNPAVELSYLTLSEQTMLLNAMAAQETTPSLSQAQRLKKFSQQGKLSEDVMMAIMSEEKKEVDRITLTTTTLSKYFPKSYTPKKMEETIIKLPEQWQRKRQREQER